MQIKSVWIVFLNVYVVIAYIITISLILQVLNNLAELFAVSNSTNIPIKITATSQPAEGGHVADSEPNYTKSKSRQSFI